MESNTKKSSLPAYYYLQPSKNGDDEAEEELYDSNGTHITSDYLNDVVAKAMADRYTIQHGSADSPEYRCNECTKILHSTGHLIAHIVVHTGENPYVCSLCQRSFANSTRLKLHLKVHCIKKLHPGLTVTRIPKGGAASSVDIPSTKGLVDMEKKSPTVNVASFRCSECDESLPKDTLYRHMKQHLMEKNILDETSRKCGRCGEGFEKDAELQQHQATCSGSIKVSSEVDLVPINKQEACSLKKQIESNPILSGLLMKETSEPPPISITTIELDTQEEPDVKLESEPEHEPEPELEQLEPSENDLTVTAAGGGFVISSVATVDQTFLEHLAQLELQAHTPELDEQEAAPVDDESFTISPTQLASTTCGLCGKSFVEKFGLRQHMRIMHADTKPYKCPECRKCFAKESSMFIHLRVHVSNRPFMCIICYKTFTRAAALNGHLSSHSHETVKCFACEETLAHVQKYAQHIENYHPELTDVFQRIRAERPEHERTKMLRHLLLRSLANMPPDAMVGQESNN